MSENEPLVSVGVPTYNRPNSLHRVLESLTEQSYSNYEIIISDNCSEDPEVEKVVRHYLDKDTHQRIKYHRQKSNFGAANNFRFVLDQAKGDYFFWNADDDVRSTDFIEVHTKFLESNPGYAASTSPNAMVKDFDSSERDFVTFGLDGDLTERYLQFFEHSLKSHGIFYGIYRMHIIKSCPYLGKDIIAADWAMTLYALSHGPIARLDEGYILNARSGVSESETHFQNYRQGFIDDIVPMYRFYSETKELYKPLKFSDRVRIFFKIMNFNKIYYDSEWNKCKKRIIKLVRS